MKISTLIDTNVLIDVWGPAGPLTEWSSSAIISCRRDGALVINSIVWSELAPLVASEAMLRKAGLKWIASFCPGKPHSWLGWHIPVIGGPAVFESGPCRIFSLVLMLPLLVTAY